MRNTAKNPDFRVMSTSSLQHEEYFAPLKDERCRLHQKSAVMKLQAFFRGCLCRQRVSQVVGEIIADSQAQKGLNDFAHADFSFSFDVSSTVSGSMSFVSGDSNDGDIVEAYLIEGYDSSEGYIAGDTKDDEEEVLDESWGSTCSVVDTPKRRSSKGIMERISQLGIDNSITTPLSPSTDEHSTVQGWQRSGMEAKSEGKARSIDFAARQYILHTSATTIQAFTRGYLCRMRDLEATKKVIKWLQQYNAPNGLTKEYVTGAFFDELEALPAGDSASRMRAQQIRHYQSATKIQAFMRGCIARRGNYQARKYAIEWLRSYKSTKAEKEEGAQESVFDVLIASAGTQALNAVQMRIQEAAISIQAVSRGFLYRKFDFEALAKTLAWLREYKHKALVSTPRETLSESRTETNKQTMSNLPSVEETGAMLSSLKENEAAEKRRRYGPSMREMEEALKFMKMREGTRKVTKEPDHKSHNETIDAFTLNLDKAEAVSKETLPSWKTKLLAAKKKILAEDGQERPIWLQKRMDKINQALAEDVERALSIVDAVERDTGKKRRSNSQSKARTEMVKTLTWLQKKADISSFQKDRSSINLPLSPKKAKKPMTKGREDPPEQDYENALSWLKNKRVDNVEDLAYLKKLDSILPARKAQSMEDRAKELVKAMKWIKKQSIGLNDRLADPSTDNESNGQEKKSERRNSGKGLKKKPKSPRKERKSSALVDPKGSMIVNTTKKTKADVTNRPTKRQSGTSMPVLRSPGQKISFVPKKELIESMKASTPTHSPGTLAKQSKGVDKEQILLSRRKSKTRPGKKWETIDEKKGESNMESEGTNDKKKEKRRKGKVSGKKGTKESSKAKTKASSSRKQALLEEQKNESPSKDEDEVSPEKLLEDALNYLRAKEEGKTLANLEVFAKFKRLDNMLPEKAGEKLEVRAQEMVKMLAWLRKKGKMNVVGK